MYLVYLLDEFAVNLVLVDSQNFLDCFLNPCKLLYIRLQNCYVSILSVANSLIKSVAVLLSSQFKFFSLY